VGKQNRPLLPYLETNRGMLRVIRKELLLGPEVGKAVEQAKELALVPDLERVVVLVVVKGQELVKIKALGLEMASANEKRALRQRPNKLRQHDHPPRLQFLILGRRS
jgi:hypothetical protein